MAEESSNQVIIIASNSNVKSSPLKTPKLTIFTRVNKKNLKEPQSLSVVEIDLKNHISGPIDGIFRIQRSYPLRDRNCDVYLLISENLELIYFTSEFGVLEFE